MWATQTGKTLQTLFRYALLAGFAFYVLNQVRKPTKWVGRLFLWIMNSSHSGVTDWGLKHVRIERDFKILDVGCGGGRTIEKLAALAPAGASDGIDYATGSVAASRAKNVKGI
jgi:SAM-dependent methyltransferase